MFQAEFHERLDPPWTLMRPVRLGFSPSGLGAPDIFVTVTQDDTPLLRIDLYQCELAHYAFQDAIVWDDSVVIGFGGHVHLISIISHHTVSISLGGYFGHLYPVGDRLLVADADRLHCIDRNGSVEWQSRSLGVDGVIVDSIDGGVITGVAQVELPIDFSDLNDVGDWRPFQLSLASGRDEPG